MIEVILYSRKDCHLCDTAKDDLLALQEIVAHHLTVIDVDSDPKFQREYGSDVPVVKSGPYTLRAPFDRKSLEILLRSADDRSRQIEMIEEDIQSGRIKIPISWTSSDRFNYWLSNSWLSIFNIFILIYVGLPFLAPVLMNSGLTQPAVLIYKIYGAACHQFAFRSWFLFGEQTYYPRAASNIHGMITYGQATGLSDEDLWAARAFTGNEAMGFKVALCQRDVAIYGGILMFGLIFGLFKRRFPHLPWYAWLLIGVLPIGLDGVSQLISQPPFNLLPFRESVPLLRTMTGWLFGFFTAWFGYPIAEDGMRDTREFLAAKLKRIKNQQSA